jgi:hypothetical protein
MVSCALLCGVDGKKKFASAGWYPDYRSGRGANVVREAIEIGETRCMESTVSPNENASDSRDEIYDVTEKSRVVCDESPKIRAELTNWKGKNYCALLKEAAMD